MRSPAVPDDLGSSIEAAQLSGALRVAGWLLIGQSVVFATAMVLAIRELTVVPTAPIQGRESAADVDRFRAVLASVERDRVFLFILLAAAFLVVGSYLLRWRGIGPRYALFGLNVLLVTAWAYTVWLSIGRLDEPDVVWGMIGSSGLATGLGYAGLSGGLVLFLVDILALTNPAMGPEQFGLD